MGAASEVLEGVLVASAGWREVLGEAVRQARHERELDGWLVKWYGWVESGGKRRVS